MQSKVEMARDFMAANPDMKRAGLMEHLTKKIGLTPYGASTYIHNIRGENAKRDSAAKPARRTSRAKRDTVAPVLTPEQIVEAVNDYAEKNPEIVAENARAVMENAKQDSAPRRGRSRSAR